METRALDRDRWSRYVVLGGWICIAIVGGYLAFQSSRLQLVRQYASGSHSYDLLFSSAAWAVPGAALLGIVVGVLKGRSGAPTVVGSRVRRHDAGTFFEHWSIALAILLLIVTGILLGNLINPRLYENVEAVGLSMDLHFIGALVLLYAAFQHLTYYVAGENGAEILLKRGDIGRAMAHFGAMVGRAREPREGKYMASAKLAYLAWAVLIGGTVVTGAIKVAAHVWLQMAPGLMQVTTWLHDVFGLGIVLMLLAHLVIVLMPASWPLLRSMFTGFVPRDYVKEHHADWYEELKKEGNLT